MTGLLVVLMAGVFAGSAWAKARPRHQHEDLFDESDLQIGFLIGPQLSGYTPIQAGAVVVNVQSSMRFVTGASFNFIYGFPRFEIDVLWNARGWVNTGDTVHSLSTPIIGKIPWEIEKEIDAEFGIGFSPDHVMFGADPHNQWLFGLIGSAGLLVDFEEFLFEFSMRYVLGFDNVSDNFNGAKPRDFQALVGLRWHF